MTKRAFYLTTPIYYVNAPPHLGSASTTIMGDAMCRYRRLCGDRVYFLTGTDEHGEKIAHAAAAAGISPQALTDANAALFREEWRRLGITNDDFIRTSEPRHQAVVRRVLQSLWDRGEIYFGEYGGHYCYGCERFYTEKEIVDGKCPDHQVPLTFIKEKNYFFRMSKYQDRLVRHLEAHPDFIQPERYRNEVLGFLREPLQDLSISRPTARLTWGIPLPFDGGYVTYVWFDALLNYVSALGYPDDERFHTFWPEAIHLIGKDILKPHGVYWPTMLWAAGLPLYRGLRVHGYWSVEGRKMSKSLGNVVGAYALAEKYGREAIRYFVMREMPFGLDADFSEEAFVARLNADLANDLGNLVSRASTLLAAHGPRPEVQAPAAAEDRDIWRAAEETRNAADRAMADFAFHRALAEIWQFIAIINRYVDATAPWALARDPAQTPRLARVLCTLAETLRYLGIVLDPFVPDAAARIRQAVGLAGPPRLEDAVLGRLAAVPAVTRLSGLFPRVEGERPADRPSPRPVQAAPGKGPGGGGTEAVARAEPEHRAEATAGSGASPAGGAAAARGAREAGSRPAVISIEDFHALDLRVAEVLAAERVPRSKKLLKLELALGDERRTLVSGIAEHYDPADLIGRKVVVVANLAPARLMGIESAGMVLTASDGGPLALLTLDKDLPSGARVS